jgi:hypothetical protein
MWFFLYNEHGCTEELSMRRLVLLLASMLIAGPAGAKTLDWHGTMDLELWQGNGITYQGSGVATVNDSSGSAHLSTLRLAGGISGSGVIPITDPETTGQVKSIRVDPVRLGTGTLTGISGAPPMGQNALPIPGFARVCIFSANCATNLPLLLTLNSGNTGIGVGGLLTLGGQGTIRISLEAAPWTLATVSGEHQTKGGNFVTLTRVGFVHGAASGTDSSTAANSGVIQLIAPQQVTTSGVVGNSTRQALFSTLTLHFIPEPGLLLLIASGVLGLGLVGRSRMKK